MQADIFYKKTEIFRKNKYLCFRTLFFYTDMIIFYMSLPFMVRSCRGIPLRSESPTRFFYAPNAVYRRALTLR